MCIAKRAVTMSVSALTGGGVWQLIDLVCDGHLVEVIDHQGEIVFTALPALDGSPAQSPQERIGS